MKKVTFRFSSKFVFVWPRFVENMTGSIPGTCGLRLAFLLSLLLSVTSIVNQTLKAPLSVHFSPKVQQVSQIQFSADIIA